jgi:hypothetical protein
MKKKIIATSFIDGMAKTLDIGNTYRVKRFDNPSTRYIKIIRSNIKRKNVKFLIDGFNIDKKIISSDWNNAGKNLKKAIKLTSIHAR